MKGVADENMVKRLGDKLDSIKIDNLTMTEQTLVEALMKMDGHKEKKHPSMLNPFPKVHMLRKAK